jgi:cytochrome d ubiquinol oxidase subunit I
MQLTSAGVSPNVGSTEVLITVVGFTLLYGVLAIVEVGLLRKRIAGGVTASDSVAESADLPVSFAY